MARMYFPIGQFVRMFPAILVRLSTHSYKEWVRNMEIETGSFQLGLPPIFSIKNSNKTYS